MRNAWIVAQRELGAMFVQPIAYAFAAILTFVTGFLFAGQLADYVIRAQFGQPLPPPSVAGVLDLFAFLLVFAVPAVTMRLLAEEQRSGTIELLMTLPVRDGEVVVGKFLSAFLFLLVTLALTLIYPLILLRFGNPDVGPIVSSYLGVILWGAALLAIGVLASSMTENQIVAFMMAFGANLGLYVVAFVGRSMVTNPTLATIFEEMAFRGHLDNFLSGLITATDVLYYLIVTAVALFAATRILESRRWR